MWRCCGGHYVQRDGLTGVSKPDCLYNVFNVPRPLYYMDVRAFEQLLADAEMKVGQPLFFGFYKTSFICSNDVTAAIKITYSCLQLWLLPDTHDHRLHISLYPVYGHDSDLEGWNQFKWTRHSFRSSPWLSRYLEETEVVFIKKIIASTAALGSRRNVLQYRFNFLQLVWVLGTINNLDKSLWCPEHETQMRCCQTLCQWAVCLHVLRKPWLKS